MKPDLNLPAARTPTLEEAIPLLQWEPKRLVTPAELARLTGPQRRRRVQVPAVVRLGRRGGRAR